MITTYPLPAPGDQFDVILISGDYWADHPHSGVGVIARVLEADGYSVGIIEKPNWKVTSSFLTLGIPPLFWGLTSGAIDSMLVNYTPLKKSRAEDPHAPHASGIPDRAIIVYNQKLREAQIQNLREHGEGRAGARPIVIGGVEASLRRFAHYDYWANEVRRPILFDAKADLLVYGPGEHQIGEIVCRCEVGASLDGIMGTCIISKEVPPNSKTRPFTTLPSSEVVQADKHAFCDMQLQFSNDRNLAQWVGPVFCSNIKCIRTLLRIWTGCIRFPSPMPFPPSSTSLKWPNFQ